MLQSLLIQNFGLIKKTSLKFEPGFTVITGETGAGKSFLIQAIELSFGARAKKKPTSDEKSILESEFNNQFFRRVISHERSRFFIDDMPEKLEIGQNLFQKKIDLHGQNDNLFLKKPEAACQILDQTLSDTTLKPNFQNVYNKLNQLKKDLKLKEKQLSEFQNQESFWEFQYEKFKNINFTKADILNAEKTVKQFKSIQTQNQLRQESIEILAGETQSILGQLNDLQKKWDPHSPIISQQINQAFDQIQVIVQDLQVQDSFDGSEYESAEKMLQETKRLEKQFNVFSWEDLMKTKVDLEDKFKRINELKKNVEDLKKSILEETEIASDLANKLHQARLNVIPNFEAKLTKKCQYLGMPPAKFEVKLEPSELNIQGKETIQFLFSANQNQAPAPLKDVASGGEIARVNLALKQFCSDHNTFIFDEIDTGVSGSIATQMGLEMQTLAKENQVIAITHLPQIAALAEHHYVVEKTHGSLSSETQIRKLNSTERTEVIARMLSGDKVTDEAIKAAESLINHSRV